ncbi:MAG: ATPase [Mycobacterium sp.]
MRMALAVLMSASCVAIAPPAAAEPAGTCPPACNRIPQAAWIAPAAIPLNSVYAWPQLAGLAVTARPAQFRFEQLCAGPAAPGDARGYAVAERAVVSNPAGQWQMQSQVVHWRGETWRGGQLALDAVSAAGAALRDCQATNPTASASLVVDQPDRIAAVISGPVILHEYLLADPVNSTVTELALWSQALPLTPWPTLTDTDVLDALGAPLCTAYLDSCP